VVFTPWTTDAFGLPKFTLVALALVVAAGLVIVRPLPRVPLPRLAVPVAALVATTALATAFSTAPSESLFGRYERLGGLVPLVVYVALAGLVYALGVARRDALVVLAAAIVAAGTMAAAYVLGQTVGLDPLDWRDNVGNEVRYQAGPLGNSNFAGSVLAISALFVPALVRRTPDRAKRTALIVAAAVLVLGVLATESRGGLLALAAGAATLAAFDDDARALVRRHRRPAAVAVAAGALALIGLAATTNLGRSESLRIRGWQWASAVGITLDHPLVGTGPDTFQLHHPQHRPLADGRELGLQIADKPHNLALEHAAGEGVLGFAAYLALVVAVVLAAVRRLRDRPTAERGLLVAFLAAAVAHVAQGLFSIDVPPLALLWWTSVGAIAALADRRFDARTARRRRPARLPTTIAVAAAGLVAALVLTLPWRADWAAARGDLAEARTLWSPQPVHHLGAAGAATQRLSEATDRQQAEAVFAEGTAAVAEARRRQPHSVFVELADARLHRVAASQLTVDFFRVADAAYRRAVALDPVDWQVHHEHGELLTAWANATGGDEAVRRRALAAFERSAEVRPDEVSTWANLGATARALGDEEALERAVEAIRRIDPRHPALEQLRRS
jgi:O-antigen ligase